MVNTKDGGSDEIEWTRFCLTLGVTYAVGLAITYHIYCDLAIATKEAVGISLLCCDASVLDHWGSPT